MILAVHLPIGRKVWNGSFELQVRGITVALGLSAVPTDKGPSSVISFKLYNSARHYYSVPVTGETCRLSILHRGGATHDDEVPGCSRDFFFGTCPLVLVQFPEDGCNLVLCWACLPSQPPYLTGPERHKELDLITSRCSCLT